jgi:hypothetical protein
MEICNLVFRQGDALPTLLFNLCMEKVISSATLSFTQENHQFKYT